MGTEVGKCECGGELWYFPDNSKVECISCSFEIEENLG